jgi:hypothetical protein
MKSKGRTDRHGRPFRIQNPSNRFIPQGDMAEIRYGVAIANSQARREGKTPKPANITNFSCRCNCFHADVN